MSWTLIEIERVIRASWTAETAVASSGFLGRAPDRPARGQCGATALVVRDLLGGDLLVADVVVAGAVDGVHYWNRLAGGLCLDLTGDQFLDDEQLLQPRVVPTTPLLPGPRRAREAYLTLRARVDAALEGRPRQPIRTERSPLRAVR